LGSFAHLGSVFPDAGLEPLPRYRAAMAAKVHHRRSIRTLYLALGFLSLAVGFVGLVLPLVPTTGPVLLAGFFFARSSERFHGWLVNHPRFGPGIRDYQAGLGISMRAKVQAVVMIVATFTVSIVFVIKEPWARAALIAVAAGVIAFILSRPTNRRSDRAALQSLER
jgi:uncharacterized membrane protein YbaN (DUF454 family)